MDTNRFIIVAGYVWTGSSAIVDLLKEYKNTWECSVEFRLIKDPYGLTDLRHQIIDRWDPLNVDNAIKDFIWLTNHLNYKRKKTSLVYGLGYGERNAFGDVFMDATKEFIESICDFKYSGSWWMSDFKSTKIQLLLRKVKRRLRIDLNDYMYFSTCTGEQFDKAAQKYLNRLFFSRESGIAILDQALPAQDISMLSHFFPNAKMIIVDRDPRDVYYETLKGGMLIGPELEKTHDTSIFVKWHRAYHQNMSTITVNNNILCINFEDLVLNYKDTVKKIEQFLELSDDDHIEYKKYFDPDASAKNIGKWKKYNYPDEIKNIEFELDGYIWKK